MSFRIGQGFDVHALVEGRRLVLAGVEIPHSKGLLGHSDADVFAHALTDALLGAAGLGDIGGLFPDTDQRFKNADSMVLLATAWQHVRQKGWQLINIDGTIVAQQPRIAPYVPQMRQRLAQVLGVAPDLISIKGKTTEHLGFTGRGEGIAAMVVAALGKEETP